MARAIFDVLREIRAGALLNEATDELAQLVRAVNDTGKGGEVSIRLKLKTAGPASATIIVDAEVVSKIPKPDREVAFFFPTKDGSLTKQDPNQMPLGLRPVGAAGEPSLGQRERLDAETGEITVAS